MMTYLYKGLFIGAIETILIIWSFTPYRILPLWILGLIPMFFLFVFVNAFTTKSEDLNNHSVQIRILIGFGVGIVFSIFGGATLMSYCTEYTLKNYGVTSKAIIQSIDQDLYRGKRPIYFQYQADEKTYSNSFYSQADTQLQTGDTITIVYVSYFPDLVAVQ